MISRLLYRLIRFVRPSGVNAVVTDYQERHLLEDDPDEIEATLVASKRIANEGYFNSVTVANLTFDLGPYKKVNIALDLDDELPAFVNKLGFEVSDLPMLIRHKHTVPMVRDGGEWQIHWDKIDQTEADGDSPQYPEYTER